MSKKKPIRMADLFSDLEQVELRDGRIIDVQPIDGTGYDLLAEMEGNPERAGNAWTIVARCLPALSEIEVKSLNPAECAAVIAIAMGKVQAVQEWAASLPGNGQAPKTAEPEPQRSSTPSDSSALESPASSAAP
jgi:hypothetical protein